MVQSSIRQKGGRENEYEDEYKDKYDCDDVGPGFRTGVMLNR